MTEEAWSSLPRPEPTERDASRLLRSLGASPSVALAGRADLDLMRVFVRRGVPVEACDPNLKIGSQGTRAMLPVRPGLPSQNVLRSKHDLILVEGLLEYSSDPLSELVAIRKSLRPDGRVRLEVPFADGFLPKKMGARFTLFKEPAVRTLFSVEGLTRLAARAGFRQVAIMHKKARAEKWLHRTRHDSSVFARWITMFTCSVANAPSCLVATARIS